MQRTMTSKEQRVAVTRHYSGITQSGNIPHTRCKVLFTHSIHPPYSPLHLTTHQTTMPYISTEALVGAALLVVVALGYQYIPKAGEGGAGAGARSSKSSKKKNKKKNKSAGSKDDTAPAVPVSSDSKTEKKSQPNGSTQQNGSATTLAPAPAAVKPKTLAQKIAPQPRKSKVDEYVPSTHISSGSDVLILYSMLAPEDLPGQHARVMRVASSNPPTPAPAPALAPPVQKVEKFSDDYASSSSSSSDSEDRAPVQKKKQDDGWGVVTGKKKSA